VLDGFAAGILAYRRDVHQPVRLLGWDPQTGRGDRAATPAQASTVARRLISNGADVILADAGGAGVGAARIALAVGHVTLVWTDEDGCHALPRFCALFVTTVQERIAVAIEAALRDVVDGTFRGGAYVGTLRNGGVGLAPFHDYDTEIPVELKQRLSDLAEGISNGSVSLDPSSYR
jgi:basic membrane protein A